MTTIADPPLSAQFDRLPPYDQAAEQCLLASVIIDPRCLAEVAALVGAQDFYQIDHQIIWGVIASMVQGQKPIDVVTLRAELVSRDQFEEIGGAAYLAQLFNTVPSAAHANHYAGIVKEKSMLRQLIAASNDALRDAYAPHVGGSVSDVIASAVTRLGQIVSSSNSTRITPLEVVADDVYTDLGRSDVGHLEPTGFADLDAQLGGIAPGEMIIVAARPSMGKSTLARGIAWRRAKQGLPTGIVSLEESKEKIARNIFSAESSVENQRIRRKQLTSDDWSRLGTSMIAMAGKPLFIADRSFRLNTIKAVVAEMVARFKVRMVLLDYLQRVQTEGRDRFSKVTEASLGICEMLKDLNVAGVVLSQLNRAVEGREDKRPGMSDLRESGQIEQDADGIIFIHREDYYHIDEPAYAPNRTVELSIAKMRDGVRGGTVKLESSLNFQRFDDVVPLFGGQQ